MTRLAVFIFAISQNCFAQIANINTCLETSLHRVNIPINPYSYHSNYPSNATGIPQSAKQTQYKSPGTVSTPFRLYLASPITGTDLFESSLSYIPRKYTRLHTEFNGSPDYATVSLSADQSLQINSQWKLAIALGGFSQWGNSKGASNQSGKNPDVSLPFFGGFQGQIFSEYKLNSQLHLSVSLEFDRIFLENSKLSAGSGQNSGNTGSGGATWGNPIDSNIKRNVWLPGQTISITKNWSSGVTMQVLWKNHSDFQFFEILGFLPINEVWLGSFSLRNDYNRWGFGIYRRLQNQSIWGLTIRYHRELQTFNAGIHGGF